MCKLNLNQIARLSQTHTIRLPVLSPFGQPRIQQQLQLPAPVQVITGTNRVQVPVLASDVELKGKTLREALKNTKVSEC